MLKCVTALMAIVFLGCSPKFTTNSPDDIVLGKTDAKSIYGAWLHTEEHKTHVLRLELSIEPLRVRFDQSCVSVSNKTRIQTESPAKVMLGKLSLEGGLTGQIQNGELRCGMDFGSGDYPVSVKDKTLTLITPAGPIKFEKISL